MASVCISKCINDTRFPIPLRPTYIHLYKWPDSDADFVKSARANVIRGHNAHPRVVDSISCRQIYLRSYTFSRKETVPQKTKKCLGKLVRQHRIKNKAKSLVLLKRRRVTLRKAKEVTCSALLSVFRRLLFCTAKIDVADAHHHRDF